MKLLSVHSFIAFKFINLNSADNHVKLVDPRYNGVSASLDILPYSCASTKDSAPRSQIMSSNHSSSTSPCTASSMVDPAYSSVKHMVNLIIHHVISKLYKIEETHHIYRRCSLIFLTSSILSFKQLTHRHLIFAQS